MARSLIEERYTWPVRAVLLGGGSLRATSYQIDFIAFRSGKPQNMLWHARKRLLNSCCFRRCGGHLFDWKGRDSR